jgi:hypothetical protein
MRRRRSLFNHVSTTIDGLENSLYEGIKIAHQNNNIEILGETVSLISNTIYTSLETHTAIVFERNLILIERLYSIALFKGDYSAYLKKTSHNSIKEKISHILYHVENFADDPNNKILIADFLRLALTSFNRVLHDILLEKDIDTYKDATYEFYTFIFSKFTHHDTKPNKLGYEAEYYVNTVAIFQYSWILYLYKKAKFTKDECLDFLKENRLSFRNYERILDTLIYIDTLPFMAAFGVENWEEDTGKINRAMARSPLSPKYWATLGMMIYLIRNSSIVTREIDPTRIRSSENFFKHYFSDFQTRLAEIKEDKELWIPIILEDTVTIPSTTNEDVLSMLINNSQEEEFLKRIDNISKSLKLAETQLSKIELIRNNERLASKPIVETKVSEFREVVGKEWYYRSFLHRLFDAYSNYNEIEDSPTIPISRIFVFSIGSKTMFIDGGTALLGSADSGNVIANHEDGEFLNSIKTVDTPVRLFNTLISCLDTLIENVKKNKFNPSVIIIGSNLEYLREELTYNENFIPKWKAKDKSGASTSDYALYKEIPVYTSYNDDFDGYVVIADFENAFLLKQVRNAKWYKNQLQVDTITIDDTEAKRIFDESPDYWKTTSTEIELTEEEAMTYIKTGVIWDINTKGQFEVKNPLAYSIGQIQVKNEESVSDANPS